MCGFPSISNPPKKPSSSSKHKKSGIRLHTSIGSHISITSIPGSLAINTCPPPAPKPEAKPAPQVPPYPTYTQTTAITSPGPYPQAYLPYENAQPYALSFNPYQPISQSSLPSPNQSHQQHYHAQERRRRSSLLNDLSFLHTLSQKLSPPKLETKPNESENKLLEAVEGMRRDMKEKERRDELEERVMKAREEGVKEGRGQQPLVTREDGFGGGYNYNTRSYDTNRKISDLSAAFLTGAQFTSQLGTRQRSRSGSRDGRGIGEQKVYVVEGRGRENSLEAVCGGLGKIADGVRRVEGRLVDADFDRVAERLRGGSYARRYS